MSRVIRLDEKSGQELEERLRAEGFEFGDLAHARFQARGPGVVVSFYESGKLVVQGKGSADFCERFLATDLGAEAPRPLDGAAIGTDEAGKGDTFGGMAVAGVLVPEGAEVDLVKAGVADSKSIGDRRIKILAPWIKDHFEHKVFALGPVEYNAKHAEVGGNVNSLLTELHGNIAIALFPKLTGNRVVVDRFGANLPVTRRLRDELPEARVVEIPRAEAHASVAAASVLARAAFLENIEDLSREWAVDFPLGSGSPVPPAMREFLELHGPNCVGEVAKSHFKNVRGFLKK